MNAPAGSHPRTRFWWQIAAVVAACAIGVYLAYVVAMNRIRERQWQAEVRVMLDKTSADLAKKYRVDPQDIQGQPAKEPESTADVP
jgi:uncharacterized membrane protein YccC